MAVMNARDVAKELVNIQKLSSLYHDAVEVMRRKAVRATVDNLWRRYRQHQKREDARSFLDWLVWKEHFEKTFWRINTGTGIATRRRWAIGYVKFLTRKELSLADDPSNLWMFDALEAAIDAKVDDPELRVVVELVPRKPVPRHGLREGGPAIRFYSVVRPSDSGDDMSSG